MMLHANKVNTSQSVAVSAWFISEGFASSGGSAEAIVSGTHGEIELALEIAQDAETLALIADKMSEHDFGFPGVYDYEVSSPFGGWLAEKIRSTGGLPSEATRKAKIVELAVEFFVQGSKSRHSISRAVERILEGLEPFTVHSYTIGSIFRQVEFNEFYMLTRFDMQNVALVSLHTGNRWSDPVPVGGKWEVNPLDWESVVGRISSPDEFEFVGKSLVKTEVGFEVG